MRNRGLPFAIRTSLCTKERQLAVDRNLAVAASARALIATTPADATPRSFYRWVRSEIDAFKAASFAVPLRPQPIASPVEPSACPAKGIALAQALAQFLDAKTSEGMALGNGIYGHTGNEAGHRLLPDELRQLAVPASTQ